MRKIILRGKPVIEGIVEGEAIVTKQRLNFLHDINKETGEIILEGHELYGKSVKDKILVLPSGVGTVGLSTILYTLIKNGVGPKGLISQELETSLTFGAILANVPMVAQLDRNPVEVIETGDLVKIDGSRGIVEIIKKEDK
ncbi:MAG: DUF126 domain-containing protein [Candidatus Odinarchaeota archaeon]|nr:DUF126 domain-containing protein [Candidatus Odinarchaeota archaeon]